MPDLRESPAAPAAPRTDSAPPDSTTLGGRRATRPWGDRAASWFRSTSEALAWMALGESVVERFAGVSAAAREPEEVRVELVRLAWKLSGAHRVELYVERSGRPPRRLTCWPPSAPIESTTEARSTQRGPISGPAARGKKGQPGPLVLQVPLRAGDALFGTLRLTSRGRRPWTPRVVRRLTTLGAIAAAAERGFARPIRPDAAPAPEPGQGPHGSSIMAAFLSFAQAQARRRHESLSLLEVAVDRLDSIRDLLGPELAEVAIDRVTRAIKSTIRASDVVARLDDGRISVLLPNASADNATKVAEAVRQAIARAGSASTTMPTLTASIGVATYPDHAHDVATLRAAVASTLARARDQGHDQIAVAPPIPGLPAPALASRVG